MALGESRTWVAVFFACLAGALVANIAAADRTADLDSDGDGLSDFDEVHKYFTDPHNADSDGDGVPDGDWLERREFAYTVHAIVQVMPPITEDALADSHQDARILARGEDWVMLEVVLYPFSTAGEAIDGDLEWRTHTASLQQYIDPGPTTNWDDAMRRDMIDALRNEAGIDATTVDDKTLVETASRWLLSRAKTCNSSAYAIHFDGHRPYVHERALAGFRRIMVDPEGTIDDQFQRELYGKGMYEHRMMGSCTSAANYLTTGLRALGIPTRTVRAIPLVDVSNDEEIAMAASGLTHHQLRSEQRSALERQRGTFSAHTFNEVYVGSRWRRLNYTNLGQGCHWPGAMGLMIVVHRYSDLAEAELAPTWGRWHSSDRSQRREPFLHNNTYRTLSVTDSSGRHATFDNPPMAAADESADEPAGERAGELRDHRTLTFTRLYWLQSAEAPDAVRGTPLDGPATFFGHVDEWFPQERDGDQIKRFTLKADLRFVLKSPGHPDLRASAMKGCVSASDGSMREVLLMIEGDLGLLAPGAIYTLHPLNENEQYTWSVADGVTLTAP